ncbi:histidine kinase N-terminal 7TM domain-containing protein [Candidatus Albibeggiatoa sp. nov. BB20]|uniref:histidine kinase N-terminal 7TM domain-containing diguanylate cyclase n=1 Tax=Candidatus Albibeggiatoa sp. nov. BB20 TaxID=3162723 RepID=UPI003365B199
MFELVIILLILSGMVTLILTITALQRSTSQLVVMFAFTMFCALIWNFGFAAEIISPTLKSKLIWANIQFFGIAFLSLGWLAMIMLATGQSRQTLRLIPFFGIIPALTILIIWTNPYHHLFRLNPSLLTTNVPFPILNSDYGAYFYAVHAPYGYFLFAASLFLLIKFWKKAPTVYRKQSFILILSVIVPLLVDLLYVLGITPIPSFNFTSIMFTLSGVLLSISILKHDFLDILPLAYEVAINEMDIGVIILDVSSRISLLNPAIEKITGVSNNQAVGKDAKQIFPTLAHVLDSDLKKTEVIILQDNTEYTYQLQRSSILHSQKEIVGQIITLHDISEQTRLLKKTEKQAITDSLTNALNRRALIMYGEQEIQRAHRYQRELSLILLDVDNFKYINDHHGHLGGDYILKKIVQTIQNIIRDNDFIFRYGGDEFVVLLIEADASQAYKISERIHDELIHITIEDEHPSPAKVLISAGVTVLTPDDNLDRLLNRADQALYKAKAAGKNQTIVL